MTDGGYEALSCRQEGCSFAETGTCMEGLAPAACPHLGTLRADEGIERLPSDRGAASEAGGRHFFGGVVPFESAHEIAAAHDTKLVVLLGEKDSGKTTLLAELHQLFLEGPVGDMMFAGSMTLPEFERRCFLARLSSGATHGDTERTKFAGDDVHLLHLCVASTVPRVEHHHLLIADVSGERSRLVRESSEEAESLMTLLRRANSVVLVVDGEAISSAATKHAALARRRALVQGLLEVGSLGADSNVLHLVTKLDVVQSREAEADVDAVCAEMTAMFGEKLPLLSYLRTAARVEHQVELSPGHGLEDVLRAWVSASRRTPQFARRPQLSSGRAFWNYTFPLKTDPHSGAGS